MDSNKICKHGRIYICKRMPMLNYLRRRGFIPYETVAEPENPRYLNWKFINSPELESAISDYFDLIKSGIRYPQ